MQLLGGYCMMTARPCQSGKRIDATEMPQFNYRKDKVATAMRLPVLEYLANVRGMKFRTNLFVEHVPIARSIESAEGVLVFDAI